MERLEDLRDRIDEIDGALVPLLEARLDVAKRVAEVKREAGLPVFHPGREQAVLEKACGRLRDPSLAPYLTALYRALMQCSKQVQESLLQKSERAPEQDVKQAAGVGYLGDRGAYSEAAAAHLFGGAGGKGYPSFDAIFEALKTGEIGCGVLPIENASTGLIAPVCDLLLSYGYAIVAECYVPVRHALLGKKGAAIEDIDTVYSHEQGLAQCAGFLARHPHIKAIPVSSTAEAARIVAASDDGSWAAIANAGAAPHYGLSVLVEGIQDIEGNATRFVAVGKGARQVRGANKVSVSFTVPHEAGALYRVLQHAALNGVNLEKIESRPSRRGAWEYFFYVELSGAFEGAAMQKTLSEMEREARTFRCLGAYVAKEKGEELL